MDLYICDECGERLYTYYKHKGVTPFIVPCHSCKQGSMVHRETVAPWDVPVDRTAIAWYRPSFKEMLTLHEHTIEHVLNGGLILEGRNYDE